MPINNNQLDSLRSKVDTAQPDPPTLLPAPNQASFYPLNDGGTIRPAFAKNEGIGTVVSRLALFSEIGGAANLNDVGDVNRPAAETDRLQDIIKQFPGPADKRTAEIIFVPARGLPDKDQRGRGIPLPENHLVPCFGQSAPPATGKTGINVP